MTQIPDNPEFGSGGAAAEPVPRSPAPPPVSTRRSSVALIVIGLVIAGGIAAAVIAFVVGSDAVSRTTAADVVAECDSSGLAIALGDDQKSLSFTYRPASESSNEIYRCVLDTVEAPSTVDARMGETRAIDGTQNAQWEGWEMFWNYHPDSGAGITLSETP